MAALSWPLFYILPSVILSFRIFMTESLVHMFTFKNLTSSDCGFAFPKTIEKVKLETSFLTSTHSSQPSQTEPKLSRNKRQSFGFKFHSQYVENHSSFSAAAWFPQNQ